MVAADRGAAHAVGGGGAADQDAGEAVDAGVEFDGDAGFTHFVALLQAVAVGIDPDAVADAGGVGGDGHEAGIEAEAVVAGDEGDRGGQAGAVGVAVAAVVALVLAGEGVAARLDEMDAVAARGQVVEEVVAGVAAAVVGGGGGGDGAARTVEQVDGDAVEAAGAVVLLAVAVAVDPDVVAEAGGLVEACVDAGVVLAGRQGVAAGVAGAAVGVAVEQVVAADVGAAEQGAVAGDEADDVVARHEVVEVVAADRGAAHAVGGGGAADQDAGEAVDAGVEFDGDAGFTHFVALLQAVAVGVDPDAVADAGTWHCRFVIAKIDTEVTATRSKQCRSRATGGSVTIHFRVATLQCRAGNITFQRSAGVKVTGGNGDLIGAWN